MEDIIPFSECEYIVEHLEPTVIEKYGGKSWLKQHNLIQRLNMQAHINAVMRGDEYVMESMSTFDKVRIFRSVEFLLFGIVGENLFFR